MQVFYAVLIRFYGLFLSIASFFNIRAKEWVTVRKNWSKDLAANTTLKDKYCWIHCASAGEFEQAIPLIQKIHSHDSQLKIAVSFFSSSGYKLYQNSNLADIFFYFPLDTSKNATLILDILKPEFVLFIRNEIWLNTLLKLKQRHIPTYLINANTKQNHTSLYRIYLKYCYKLFTKIFTTQEYGNTKLERVVSVKETEFTDEVLKDFCKDSITLILGSSWQTEEEWTAEFYKINSIKYPNLKLIIAPHEYDTTTKSRLEKLFNSPLLSYQNYTENSICNILLLDKKGVLKYVYRFADIAIIGGGFHHHTHNVAEAAIYGLPTIIGKNYNKFEEVIDLVKMQCTFSATDYTEFESKLSNLLANENLRKSIKDKLNNYFNTQNKASEKIIREILIKNPC